MNDANVMTVDEYRGYVNRLLNSIIEDAAPRCLTYIELEDILLARIHSDRKIDDALAVLGDNA